MSDADTRKPLAVTSPAARPSSAAMASSGPFITPRWKPKENEPPIVATATLEPESHTRAMHARRSHTHTRAQRGAPKAEATPRFSGDVRRFWQPDPHFWSLFSDKCIDDRNCYHIHPAPWRINPKICYRLSKGQRSPLWVLLHVSKGAARPQRRLRARLHPPRAIGSRGGCTTRPIWNPKAAAVAP